MSDFETVSDGYSGLIGASDDSSESSEAATPESENIVFDGVTVHIDYRIDEYNKDCIANLSLPLEDCLRLTEVPRPAKARYVDDINLTVDGKVYHTVFGLSSIDYIHSQIRWLQAEIARKRSVDELQDRLDGLISSARQMEQAGLPVVQLDSLIDQARHNVRWLNDRWVKVSSDTAQSSIRAVENEIDRIKDGGSQLLVDELIAGRVDHPHVRRNASIIDQINTFMIRYGDKANSGFDEGKLYDFYTERVGDVASVRELASLNLLIPVGDYVLDDPYDELGLAPLEVQLEGRGGLISHKVTYDYRDVDGEKVAVGTISVLCPVLDRYAADSGKKSGFPALPYGIRLWVQVVREDQVIASGWHDDELLQTRVEKRIKGLKRGKKISHADQNQHDATPPPPWLTTRVRSR